MLVFKTSSSSSHVWRILWRDPGHLALQRHRHPKSRVRVCACACGGQCCAYMQGALGSKRARVCVQRLCACGPAGVPSGVAPTDPDGGGLERSDVSRHRVARRSQQGHVLVLLLHRPHAVWKLYPSSGLGGVASVGHALRPCPCRPPVLSTWSRSCPSVFLWSCRAQPWSCPGCGKAPEGAHGYRWFKEGQLGLSVPSGAGLPVRWWPERPAGA